MLMMSLKNFRLFVFLFFISCASVIPPSGGPEDVTPPKLVLTEPENFTSIYEGQTIKLNFSEFLSEDSIRKSVSIYPMLNEILDIQFSGNRFEIKIPPLNKGESSYFLIIDKSLRDENKVSLDETIIIPLTSESSFTKNYLAGNLYGDNDNISILLWNKKVNFNEEFLPSPYLVLKNVSSFSVPSLPIGEYTVAAIKNYTPFKKLEDNNLYFSFKNYLEMDNRSIDNVNFFIPSISNSEKSTSIDEGTKNSELGILRIKKPDNLFLPYIMLKNNQKELFFPLKDNETIDVPEGVYQLFIFDDLDKNQKISFGNFENSFGEYFIAFNDSITIRANWELDISNISY